MIQPLQNPEMDHAIWDTCICPVCHGGLEAGAGGITCRGCRRRYPFSGGMPNFITDSELSEKIQELSRDYDEKSRRHSGSPKSCGYSSNMDYLSRLNLLKRWLHFEHMEGKTVLDIGCGTGLMTEALTQENTVWGVDVSLGLLKVSQRRGIKTLLSSADRIPFHDDYFDIVLCIGVIPYYQDPGGIFSEIYRSTRPGGKIVISSTTNSILIRSVRSLKKIMGLSSHLAHLYTAEEIAVRLQKEGGTVLDACVGYGDKICSVKDGPQGLRFRLFSRTAAVLAAKEK